MVTNGSSRLLYFFAFILFALLLVAIELRVVRPANFFSNAKSCSWALHSTSFLAFRCSTTHLSCVKT